MMARRDIRLVLADVDGTLLTDDKELSPATISAVRRLRDAGIALAITSGRPPRGMSMLVEPLGLASTIAGLNGGVFVRPDLSVIDSRPLDPETASQALKLILDQGLDAWVYTADAWLIRDVRAPHVSREAWTVKFDAQIVDTFTTALLDQAVKIVGVSDDADRIAACEKMLQDAIGTRASAALSQPYYLDVTNHDANKGAVVDKLSTLMAVAPEHIAAIGDMPNDILMFEKSGFSVAMGNASEMVKARASAVAESNNHDGFAKAIDRFILGHSQ